MPIATLAQAIVVPRGSAVRHSFSPDPSMAASDIPVTGFALSYLVRATSADGDDAALIEKTTAVGGVVIVSGPLGTYYATLTRTDTFALAPGLYDWEVWRTDSGSETRLAYGKLQVVRSVKYPA